MCRWRKTLGIPQPSESSSSSSDSPPLTEDAFLLACAGFIEFLRSRLETSARATPARMSRAIDSAASRHITDLRTEAAAGDAHPIRPLTIQTVLGSVRCSEATPVSVPFLGTMDHLNVEGAPPTLCMGKLIEDGYEVRWKSTKAGGRGFELYGPDGALIPTRVEDNVPVIDEAGSTALGPVADAVSNLSDEQIFPLVASFLEERASRGLAARQAPVPDDNSDGEAEDPDVPRCTECNSALLRGGCLRVHGVLQFRLCGQPRRPFVHGLPGQSCR